MRTWKILDDDKQGLTPVDYLPFRCWHCKCEAELPIYHKMPIIAILPSNGIVFDPPGYKPQEGAMAHTIQCRTCKHIFSDDEE